MTLHKDYIIKVFLSSDYVLGEVIVVIMVAPWRSHFCPLGSASVLTILSAKIVLHVSPVRCLEKKSV